MTLTSAIPRQGLRNTAAVLLCVGVATFGAGARAATGPESFAPLVSKVKAAVVNISTTQVQQSNQDEDSTPEFKFPPGSPWAQLFRRLKPEHAEKLHALGSGFIIDPAGYIVTNNHVAGDATDISVTMQDGAILKAKLVGHDERTDLALLKVDADRALPAVSWGDSEQAQVGDWIVAVGNPFGLGGTVTAGIISARGRDIHSGPYDDYLQLDAPINRGNSGGPTFNLDGQVIGINTAIYSPSGGSVGIGFAIPSGIAKPVIEQLRATGHVDRGWLGVQIQPVTSTMATALGLPSTHGALVAAIVPDSPAAKAGVEQGDVIMRYGSKDIDDPRDLSRAVADTKAGSTQDLQVLRNGETTTLKVEIAQSMGQEDQSVVAEARAPSSNLGLSLAPLDDDTRESLGISASVKGAVVTSVDPDGTAAEHGIRPGDVIRKVGRTAVKSPRDVSKAIQAIEKSGRKSAAMLIERNGSERFIAVPLAQG